MDSRITNDDWKRPALFSPSASGLGKNKRPKSNSDNRSTDNAITLRNEQTSRLLRLLAELRNKIYGYVCGGFLYGPSTSRDRHTYGIDTARYGDSSFVRGWKDKEDPTVLSRVSRQLHVETWTWTLPLELNTLRVFDLKSLRLFVNSLSQKQRDAIRSIRISVSATKRVARKINQFWEKSFTEAPPQEGPESELLSPFLTFSGLETVTIRLGKNYRHLDVFDHEDWLSHVPKRAGEAMIRQLGGRPGLEIKYGK